MPAGRALDRLEAVANAVAGVAVSLALVWLLRRVGLWDASAPLVVAAFFVASAGRSYLLRRLFRAWGGRNG